VAFSCKGRICPSCCARRMGELAAHLVDGVLGGLPARQCRGIITPDTASAPGGESPLAFAW